MSLGDLSQHQSERTQWEEAHGKKTGSASLLIRERGWHCGSRSVLVSRLWPLLPLQPQGAIMRNPLCIRFRDECIVYLVGFTTNLPFLLSKWNHNGIHIGLMYQYDDFKGWTGGGKRFTDGWGGSLQGFANDITRFFFVVVFWGGWGWGGWLSLTSQNDNSLKKTLCEMTGYNLLLAT